METGPVGGGQAARPMRGDRVVQGGGGGGGGGQAAARPEHLSPNVDVFGAGGKVVAQVSRAVLNDAHRDDANATITYAGPELTQANEGDLELKGTIATGLIGAGYMAAETIIADVVAQMSA